MERRDPAGARIRVAAGHQRLVEAARRDEDAGRPAEGHRRHLPGVRRAAAHALEQIAQRQAELRLDHAGARHVSGEPEHLGAVTAAEPRPPLGAATDDQRDGKQGFDIVDDGGPAVDARLGRERRLRPRHRAAALERLHQRRLLAQDEPARAAPDLGRDRELAAEHALAHEARRARLLQRPLDVARGQMRLAVDVEDHARSARRVGGQQRAFQEPVGIALQEVAVLEDAGLALLAVDDQVLEGAGRAARAFPLERGLEVGAAAAPQPRALDGLDEALGLRLGQHALERLVRAATDRVGDIAGIGDAAAAHQLAPLAGEERGDVGVLGGCARAHRGQQRRGLAGGHAREDARGLVAAQHGDHRRGPAHAVAAAGDDAGGELAARDLVAQRAERVGRADREAAGAGADDQGERGVPLTPALSPEGRGRSGRTLAPGGGEGRVRGRGEQGVHRAHFDPPAMLALHLHHRRHRAVERAVEPLERDRAVGGRRARRDTEAPLAGGQHVEPAPDAAREPHADAHHAAAGLGEPELRIVRGDAVHLAARHAEMIRRLLQRRGREPAIAVLERVQRGQQPGPLAGEAAQDVGRLGHGLEAGLSGRRARDRAGRPRRSPCAAAGRSRRARRPGRRAEARSRTR